MDSISGTIAKYNEKIEKLNVVKQCITAQNNTFDASEGIYYSMISSYLASYNYTALSIQSTTGHEEPGGKPGGPPPKPKYYLMTDSDKYSDGKLKRTPEGE